jgi:hypothetical protein
MRPVPHPPRPRARPAADRSARPAFAGLAAGLAIACTVGLPLACDRSDSGAGVASLATDDSGFTLLDVMIQIEHAYTEIEPNLRNPDALEATADAAQRLIDWSVDPLFEDFTRGERFFSEPEPFLEQRAALEAGARDVLEGAQEADFVRLRRGFIAMKQTCIGCHKRFSPAY